MAEQEEWHWQEPGTAWRGVGLYHITLTIPSRQPLLGRFIILDGDASKAKVLRTALGNALVDSLLGIPRHHPEVQVLHFCLMPDHLHAVLYVRRQMSEGIGSVVRGFWQASKKLGRAWSEASFVATNGIRGNCQEGVSQRRDIGEVRSGSPAPAPARTSAPPSSRPSTPRPAPRYTSRSARNSSRPSPSRCPSTRDKNRCSSKAKGLHPFGAGLFCCIAACKSPNPF